MAGAAARRAATWTAVIASTSFSSPGRMLKEDSVEVTDQVYRVLEVGRVVGLELDVLPGVGVLETESYGVQPLSLQPQPLGQDGVAAVQRVPDAGVFQRLHVHPDLVGASRLQLQLEQAREPMRLESVVVGHAVPAPRHD